MWIGYPHVPRTWWGWRGGPNTGEENDRKTFLDRAKSFLKSEDGPTATEYAVMLALIIIVAIGTITTLGTTVKGVFANVNTQLAKVPGGS